MPAFCFHHNHFHFPALARSDQSGPQPARASLPLPLAQHFMAHRRFHIQFSVIVTAALEPFVSVFSTAWLVASRSSKEAVVFP